MTAASRLLANFGPQVTPSGRRKTSYGVYSRRSEAQAKTPCHYFSHVLFILRVGLLLLSTIEYLDGSVQIPAPHADIFRLVEIFQSILN